MTDSPTEDDRRIEAWSRDPRTRVLVLIDTLVNEGAERVAVDLARGLDPRGWAPLVLATRRGGPLALELEHAGVPVVVLERRRRFDLAFLRRARRAAKAANLVHSHMFGSNVWGALLANLTGTPLVAHEHNWTVDVDERRRWMRWWIEPAASLVLCVSQDVQAVVGTRRGIGSGKVRVLQNGVRLDDALDGGRARDALGLPRDRNVVGIVAALRSEKAHGDLLEALHQLVHVRGPGGAASAPLLCVVGDGLEREALHARAHALGLDEHVVWAGERADARQLVRAFDVGVLCSHTEGMPLSALELLAAGVPMVATAVGGLAELGGVGACANVPVGDPAALASAIDVLLRDPGRAASLGRAGRQHVASNFALDGTLAELQHLYRGVAGPRGAAGPRGGDGTPDGPTPARRNAPGDGRSAA